MDAARWLFCILIFTLSAGARDLDLTPWEIRHPHPTAFGKALANDGNKFVLVDGYGYIFTSIGGRNWTVQHRSTASLGGIAFGTTNFIAVGARGSILASPDATNWTALSSPVTNDLNNIAFNGHQFLVVGNEGAILSSTNGLDFILHDRATSSNLMNIAFAPGATLAIGQQTVLVSTNEAEWTPALVTTTNLFRSVAYYNGAYFNGWYSTTNPMVWTNKLGSTGFTNVCSIVATTNRLFRALNGGRFQSSSTGNGWGGFSTPTLPALYYNLSIIAIACTRSAPLPFISAKVSTRSSR